jgi:DNA-binding protein H-NS
MTHGAAGRGLQHNPSRIQFAIICRFQHYSKGSLMTNASEIQNQIAAAEAQIRQLREKLQAQKSEERRAAISQAKALVKAHGLTAAELGLSPGGRRNAPAPAKTSTGRAKVPAKYRDPATGNSWTGRGKTPNWLSAKLAAGRSRADFAV